MKTRPILLAILTLSGPSFVSSLSAQLAIPSDGSDGALVVTTNTVIDLSRAVTGVWSNANYANTGKGIYDSNKWAVVFKYSSVSIANGATLTFSNHPTHAPVIWLVNGNVTIDGVVNLDGEYLPNDNSRVAEPGPGGFRGGAKNQWSMASGNGFGPGGGNCGFVGHGVYGDVSGLSLGAAAVYGNDQIVPLIGGSGGYGWDNNGGAGGGAILVAASGTMTISASGFIHANGSVGASWGSGGGVRIVANQILGSGRVEATSPAFPGRIRLEANSVSASLSLNPVVLAVAPSPLVIWPDANAPTVRVVSVGGQPAPLDPIAAMTPSGDDMTIVTTNVISIELQTANFPTNGTVYALIKPRNEYSGYSTNFPAKYVSGDASHATWRVTTALPLRHTVIQARAVSN